jgi:signal transduction histidine kinase
MLPREYGGALLALYGRTVTGPTTSSGRLLHGAVVVLVLSSLLVAVVAVVIAVHEPARGIAYGVLGEAAVVAVAVLARRAPGPAVVTAGTFATAASVLQPIPPFALLPFGVGIVLAIVAGARVWAYAAVGGAYAVSLVALFVSDAPLAATRGFGTMVLLLVAVGAGSFVRARRLRQVDDARRQVDRQRAAVEEERLRIARELHDVLAHSLSSITVQAGVGLHLAADRPEAATEALETIRTASREALDEVRGVLGVLRGDEEAAPLVPGPDLDALRPLVEETRRTGARVSLADGLVPRPARPVQLALYRVVQEALTNARRHAPGAAVDIVLEQHDGAAVARVRDHLPGARPAPPVAGNGITGMRERAAALGGTLEVRPGDDGLEVVARIPVRSQGGTP